MVLQHQATAGGAAGEPRQQGVGARSRAGHLRDEGRHLQTNGLDRGAYQCFPRQQEGHSQHGEWYVLCPDCFVVAVVGFYEVHLISVDFFSEILNPIFCLYRQN